MSSVWDLVPLSGEGADYNQKTPLSCISLSEHAGEQKVDTTCM